MQRSSLSITYNFACKTIGMRVVLVDPSRIVLKCVSKLLQERGDDVFSFTDGQAALDYIRTDRSVETLITSAEPESMSGLDLCWETRALATSRRPIYVIMMSSNQHRGHLVKALDAGADDFIGKPPASEELYARLRAAARLSSMQRELIHLASTDPLTGVLNRRAFFERMQESHADMAEIGSLSAIMLDIDHFKSVNDVYGHDIGDKVIAAVATAATSAAPMVGRLGGEEFVVLLGGKGLAETATVAEELRQRVRAVEIATSTDPVRVTCSFGVSEWQGDEPVDQFLKRADLALYAAKKGGRDRVVVADDAFIRHADEYKTQITRSAARKGEAPQPDAAEELSIGPSLASSAA